MELYVRLAVAVTADSLRLAGAMANGIGGLLTGTATGLSRWLVR